MAELTPLRFRDPVRAEALAKGINDICAEIGRDPITLMHVCGSHEQAIARFGLRTSLPKNLDVIMGPGCPVCITDLPEVDEGVALALQGVKVCTYGDMLRVPGTSMSLADAQSKGGNVAVVYSPTQAIEIARATGEEVVFFATGFETTAVTTAAALLGDPPPNFSVLSAHKYIPPAMEIVCRMPDSRIEGFLAAGHAAAITGSNVFEPLAKTHKVPIVVAGFEPLDILGAVLEALVLIRDGRNEVANLYPRCVSAEGNAPALKILWEVFELEQGWWRGIADIPDGNLRLRAPYARWDARKRFDIDIRSLWGHAPHALAQSCVCGDIMAGKSAPTDCKLYGKECTPDTPVGACMVSSEGSCRIWQLYGGRPDLSEVG
jgi:hydrogenase expression/formation protein HypD